jgi:hypothetical protein
LLAIRRASSRASNLATDRLPAHPPALLCADGFSSDTGELRRVSYFAQHDVAEAFRRIA